jgi:ABC-type transport system substrate-binding protein
MFYDGWVNLLATPDDGMRPLFNSANIGPYGNFAYFNNTTVSHDLVTAGKELNITQRDALYTQVQNILASQAVEVPLFNLENVIPMTDNIHNLYIYPTFDIFIDQASMS